MYYLSILFITYVDDKEKCLMSTLPKTTRGLSRVAVTEALTLSAGE
jgi:hypothetical protein